MPTSWSPLLADLFTKILSLSPHGDVYLVGGALRDSLLDRPSHDFDFIVQDDAIHLAKQLARAIDADFYVLDQEFGAARVIVSRADGPNDFLDFATLRGHTIEADLRARDFTVNAMALNLRDGTTRDPLLGTADLQAKVIRTCSPSAMEEDPIRVLRAVRLAVALEFKIEAGTRRDLGAAAHLLPSVSAERIRDELFRMLGGQRVHSCMRALELLGLLPHFLPELQDLKGLEQPAPHVHEAWEHTLSVMRSLEDILDLMLHDTVQEANGMQASLLTLGIGRYRQQLIDHFSASLNPDRPLRALVQFAALYHDIGKPATRSRSGDGSIHFVGHEKEGAFLAAQRAAHLNLSNAEVKWIDTVVANHLRFFFLASRKETGGEAPTRRAIYHFFRDADPAGVELILLGLADLRGTRDHLLTEGAWSAWIGVARSLLENLWEKPQEAVAPARLLDGNDIMRELILAPGPAIGLILEAIREAQAAGEVANRNEALAFARDWLARNMPATAA